MPLLIELSWTSSCTHLGICFSNSTIVPLYNPTNPSQPCLSCTRQFCLDQKLPICRGAELPDLDTDTATGKEGDVEARCFSALRHRDRDTHPRGRADFHKLCFPIDWDILRSIRTRLPTRSIHRHPLPIDRIRLAFNSEHSKSVSPVSYCWLAGSPAGRLALVRDSIVICCHLCLGETHWLTFSRSAHFRPIALVVLSFSFV